MHAVVLFLAETVAAVPSTLPTAFVVPVVLGETGAIVTLAKLLKAQYDRTQARLDHLEAATEKAG